jgi:short-subunit dehydrogenase
MSRISLRDARIVVTGASRGIGAALARRLAGEGARVALVARSAEAIAKLAADIGGDAYPADLADPGAVGPLVERITRDGAVDVLVNNAGVDLTGSLVELPPERIRELIDVNLLAPMLLSRAVIPGMVAQRRGHIMNISSLSGTNAVPGLAPYSASKAGLSHFTASLRAELKGTPITTTLAEIGPVDSAMMENLYAYPPTRRALARLVRLKLAVSLDMDDVVAALVDAVERRRRHLRLPRRAAFFPMLVETPRRLTELLLAGVDAKR